jgi:hypothetical protein
VTSVATSVGRAEEHTAEWGAEREKANFALALGRAEDMGQMTLECGTRGRREAMGAGPRKWQRG